MKQVFNNPLPDSYNELKRFVLSPYCKWTYVPENIPPSDNPIDEYDPNKYKHIGFYSHSFLDRPRGDHRRYPIIDDKEFIDLASAALCDIMTYNGFCPRSFYRICANATHPHEDGVVPTIPHVDHQFDHGNMLLYLTDAGGKTFVETENGSDSYEYHDPKEDDVLLFAGKHYNETPATKRRVIIVATFM